MIRPPRLDGVAQLPTPITPLDRLSAQLGGPRVWVKRDDDTGGLVSGNKVRKLAYVLREALDAGADTVITCGGLQSNHCRATAVLARRLGLQPVLCLRGEAPSTAPQGNLLLDKLLGAEIRYVTPEVYQQHDAYMAELAEAMRGEGRRPFVIAEGASMATGCWGYIEAVEEIVTAERALGVRFDHVVHATGSGGTSAGLELGKRLFGLQAQIAGVPVCDDADYFRPLIARIATEASARFELGLELPAEEIALIDGYVGRGYGLSTPEEWALIRDLARLEGLVLDPVYSGKAMRALKTEIAAGRLEGEHILFLHTGGVYGLLAKAEEIVFDDLA